jgi:hypothetical protein
MTSMPMWSHFINLFLTSPWLLSISLYGIMLSVFQDPQGTSQLRQLISFQTQNLMVKGMSLHSHISVNLTSHEKMLIFFRTMKYVDCLSSHLKGGLNLGLGHYQ